MGKGTLLLTGFPAYGKNPHNPSEQLVLRFDGRQVAGLTVVGRTIPVSVRRLRSVASDLVSQTNPDVVISLGLWPGEPVIRLERVAVNVADFEIPDNDGVLMEHEPVVAEGPHAYPSTLPIQAMEQALLDEGIPARISNSAGTFLCNATMYTFLDIARSRERRFLSGFVHLPYMPEQVATLLRELREARTLEFHQRADLCSMSIDTMERALQTIITVCADVLDHAS